jgi:hypothetical protein
LRFSAAATRRRSGITALTALPLPSCTCASMTRSFGRRQGCPQSCPRPRGHLSPVAWGRAVNCRINLRIRHARGRMAEQMSRGTRTPSGTNGSVGWDGRLMSADPNAVVRPSQLPAQGRRPHHKLHRGLRAATPANGSRYRCARRSRRDRP